MIKNKWIKILTVYRGKRQREKVTGQSEDDIVWPQRGDSFNKPKLNYF